MRRSLTTAFLSFTLLYMTAASIAWAVTAEETYKKSRLAYNEGQFQQALELLKQTVQLDPKYSDAYFDMGAVYYNQKRYSEALEAFKKLLDIDPNDQTARYETARIYEKLNRLDEAIASFEMVTTSSTRYNQAQENVTRLRTRKQELAAAAQASQAASQSVNPASSTTSGPSAEATLATVNLAPLKAETVVTGKPSEYVGGFSGPTGIAMDAGGNLYVANFSKNTIMMVNPDGVKKQLAAGYGINGPVGMSIDRQTGDLYVANHLDNTISRITPQGKVSVVATGLKKPYNLYLDEARRILFVSQQETNSIAKIKLN